LATGHHAHDESQDGRRCRAGADQVAEEDDPAPARGPASVASARLLTLLTVPGTGALTDEYAAEAPASETHCE
jgi:hypothetical protein